MNHKQKDIVQIFKEINLEETIRENKEYVMKEDFRPKPKRVYQLKEDQQAVKDFLEAFRRKPKPVYQLNEEQQAVMEEIDKDHNVFVTGPGGVGKSFIIKHIRKHLEQKGKVVAVTSLTGMASLLIGEGARTIHSWSGLGFGNRSVDDYFNFIKVKHKKARDAWRNTNVLIIDEISMMSDEFFEKLDALAKLIRWCPEKPFGGLQILCFGDFYQLPPINTKFVFESSLWNETLNSVVPLETIYRQKDPVFQKMLNEIREGNVSDETDRLLKTRLNLDFSKEEIQPTKIFTRRDIVDKVNNDNLNMIQGEERMYKVFTKGKVSTDSIKNALERMDNSAQYQNELVLKVGAQVMLIANVNQEEGLVNGRLGIVTEVNAISVMVRFKGGYDTKIDMHEWKLEDNDKISRNQIPLILAYAITTHKCQGSTLDSAYIDIGSSIFEYGQAYVALSRVKNLDALYLHAYSRKSIRAHPKVIDYYESLLV